MKLRDKLIKKYDLTEYLDNIIAANAIGDIICNSAGCPAYGKCESGKTCLEMLRDHMDDEIEEVSE